MRSRFVRVLGWLYVVIGVVLAWLAWSRGRAGDAASWDELPWWAFAAAAAIALALGAGILRRAAAALWALRVLHALLAALAIVLAARAWLAGEVAASDPRLGLLLLKAAVHALLAWFWWGSREASAWFVGPDASAPGIATRG